MSATRIVANAVNVTVEAVRHEIQARAYQAANELRTSALYVLRGTRTGRTYRVPGTGRTYTASAPGEPPAVRTGIFRMSWTPRVSTDGDSVVAMIESDVMVGRYNLGELLEGGTSKMAPRPYKERVIERAMPNIKAIYSRPYR